MRHFVKLEALSSRVTGTCVRTLATLTAGVEEMGMPVLTRAPAVEELRAGVVLRPRAGMVEAPRAGAVESEGAAEVWLSAMARSDREVGIGESDTKRMNNVWKRHTMGRLH
jgi:hypothetical protein